MAAVLVIGFSVFIAMIGTGVIDVNRDYVKDPGIPSECAQVLAGAFVHTVEAQRAGEPFYVTTDRETECLELALEGE